MNQLKEVVNAVLEQQKLHLAPSTYDARKNYLKHLAEYGDCLGIPVPSQELYDAYVSRAATPDLRFQLLHAVRLVDKEAGTKALTPEGKLYNEPKLPSSSESEKIFQNISFPVSDCRIDTGHLIRRAESEMIYLHLSASTRWQYMQAWRELYTFLYLSGSTIFTRESCNAFVEDTTQKHQDGSLHEWKRKIRRRSVCVLLEVADTGCFQWKLFLSKKTRCTDDTLEELRQQYLTFLRTRNFEKKTISLYDYAFRSFIEGTGVPDVNGLGELQPSQVQSMLVLLSERLCLNSRGTVFPIIRQILSYLYVAGFIPTDFSGMVLTPAYKNTHLRPYITVSDEEKLFCAIEEAPLRTKAMMRLGLRLGLRDIDICCLRFSQIDWKNDQIILEQEKTGVTMCLPLLEDFGNAIMDYILNERPAEAEKNPYVFVRMQAPYKKLESMYMVCSKLFDKAEVRTVNRDSCGVHVCRYTLTHKLLLNKIPHQVITDTLGHVSKESDKPYLSMEEQMLKECPLDFSQIGQKYWEEGDHCTLSDPVFRSKLGADFEAFISQKRASGYPYNTSSKVLGYLDAMIADDYPDCNTLSKEICDAWIRKCSVLHQNTLFRRVTPVRQFAKYLVGTGKSAYIIPGGIPRKQIRYDAHIFTESELKAFFASIDSCKKSPFSPLRCYVIPVIFRLIYTCGLRASEARLLRTDDIDLSTGKIFIRESKGWEARIVFVSDDMLDLLCRYDHIIRDTYPDRTVFFPNQSGDYYSKSTLDVWFHEFWDPLPEATMAKGNPPRVHDFRHSYCVYRLNKWVSEHAALNALYPYLSEFMGHSNFADTDYYLTLAEPFYPEFELRMRPVNASILPEVPHED